MRCKAPLQGPLRPKGQQQIIVGTKSENLRSVSVGVQFCSLPSDLEFCNSIRICQYFFTALEKNQSSKCFLNQNKAINWQRMSRIAKGGPFRIQLPNRGTCCFEVLTFNYRGKSLCKLSSLTLKFISKTQQQSVFRLVLGCRCLKFINKFVANSVDIQASSKGVKSPNDRQCKDLNVCLGFIFFVDC